MIGKCSRLRNLQVGTGQRERTKVRMAHARMTTPQLPPMAYRGVYFIAIFR